MPNSTANSHVYDILVVGAGPVGLLCALGAYARGCRNIAVIDQTRAFRRAGEVVELAPNGMTALRLIAPKVADAIRAQGRTNRDEPISLLDVDGTFIGEYEGSGAVGGGSLTIGWSNLQKTLIDAMPNEVEITVNTQLSNLEFVVEGNDGEDEELVRAECLENRIRVNPFVNWENDPMAVGAGANDAENDTGARVKSLYAKIVIGADGINSVCRAKVYRSIDVKWERFGKAEYTGFMSFKGKGSLALDNATLGAKVTNYLQDSAFAGVYCRENDGKLGSPFSIVCRIPEDMRAKVGHEWIFILHLAVEERLAQRNHDAGGHAALHEHALMTMRNAHYPESLQQLARVLLAETAKKNFVVARPLYVVPVDHPAPFERLPTAGEVPVFPEGFYRPFGHRRVFLAGDSLHGGPPTMAQGTSMGFEDCCELIDVLAKAHGWGNGNSNNPGQETLKRALAQYRSARIERLSKIQMLSMNKVPAQRIDERASNWKEACNFVPIANGW